MRIISVQAQEWTLPLRAPFRTAQRVAYDAQNVWIQIETDDSNVSGYGASAPVQYVTGETIATVLSAIECVAETLVGASVDRLQPLISMVGQELFDTPAALAGVEMALFDVWAKRWHIPLWQFFGGSQNTLTTDITIPIVSPEEAGMLAKEAFADGFGNFKIKVGDDDGHDVDLERVAAIVAAAPSARLRIDANQGFTPDDAISFVHAVLATGVTLDLVEQPVPKDDLTGLKYVKERVDVPVFADEAALGPASVTRLLDEDAVDGVNLKLMKCGIVGAIECIRLCRAAGKRLMLGCMLESGLGIAAAAQLAGGSGAFDFIDLDSHRLLAPINSLFGGFVCVNDTLQLDPPSAITESYGWGVSRTSVDAT